MCQFAILCKKYYNSYYKQKNCLLYYEDSLPSLKGGTKMKTNFLSFFTTGNKRKDEKTDIVRQVDDVQFKIMSDTVKVSALEADMIVKIICDEMKQVKLYTGNVIARRISEEVNRKKICTAHVNGGTDGKKWLIRVSNYPLEFID